MSSVVPVLSAVLLAALIAAPLATIALFVPLPAIGTRADGPWPWTRRLVFSLVASAVMAAVVGIALRQLGVSDSHVKVSLVTLAVVSVVWLPFTRRWTARAHLCWAWSTLLFVSYLAFMLVWTFVSGLVPLAQVAGVALWLLEVFAALLGCAYLWELCDVLGSQLWRRRAPTAEQPAAAAEPFVSLHVPAYNEPPDMVIATLTSLRALDYPRLQIVVVDDNSDDEELWRPVQAWCCEHGVTFAHLDDWPGYKSGALNYALDELTDERAELVGVIDSDYQIEPDFLRRCVPLFRDPSVGFIQAPQDYREWESSAFYRRLYYSYKYFFAVSQPSRNERDGAIFAGTMGLIRRRALEEVGGWDEWCITEDAELSLRLLRAGWSGLHVDHSFGNGIMPLTFEGLKGQRFRWCFGGIQILRRNWRSLLPGGQTSGNAMSTGQRWAYLSGALQWYGDLLGLVFFLVLLGGAVNLALGGDLLFRKLSGFLVGAIPLLMAIGLLRAVALLRRSTGAAWREALGAFLVWQSTSLVVARASVQALYAREATFLRTPKTADEPRLLDAVRGNWAEGLLALLGLVAIAGTLRHGIDQASVVVAALLVWPTVSFAAAPANSIAAQRAVLPPDLQQRRRLERRGLSRGVRRATAATGVLVAAGAVAALAVAALAPGHSAVSPPQILGPARAGPGGDPTLAPQSPSTPGPSQSGPGTSPTATSGTATPSPSPSGTSPSASASTSPPSPSTTPTSSPTTSPSPSQTPSATTS